MATDLTVLQTRRAEADAALHELQMGKAVVEVGRDGRKLVYSRANLAELRSYIADLDAQIEAQTGVSAGPRRGSMRPMFV